MEKILLWDRTLFIYLNHLPHNLFFDTFFGFFTGIGYLGIIWFVLGLYLIYFKKYQRKLLFTLLIAGFLSLLVELVLKNIIGRLRPQFTIPGTINPYDFIRSYSFPSGHATISFAGFYLFAKIDQKNKFIYLFLALIISFSRIYLGKHYPTDVIAGAIIGLGIGYISRKLISMGNRK